MKGRTMDVLFCIFLIFNFEEGKWDEKFLFEVKAGTLNFQIGVDESGLSTCQYTVDKDGNIYIYDRYNRAIKKFNEKGKYLAVLSLPEECEVWGIATLSDYLYLICEMWRARERQVIYSLRKYTSNLKKEKVLLQDTLGAQERSPLMVQFLGELLIPQGVLETDWKYLYVPDFREEALLKIDTTGHIVERISIEDYKKDAWMEYMEEEFPYVRGSFGKYFIYYKLDSTKICNSRHVTLWKTDLFFYPLGVDTNWNIYGYASRSPYSGELGVVKITPQGKKIKYDKVRFGGTGFASHILVTSDGTIYDLEWVQDSLWRVTALRFWKYLPF